MCLGVGLKESALFYSGCANVIAPWGPFVRIISIILTIHPHLQFLQSVDSSQCSLRDTHYVGPWDRGTRSGTMNATNKLSL